MTECVMCQKVKSTQSGQNPSMINEFKNSFLVLGDHQYHKGYCVLIFKTHVREMHELAFGLQQELFQELMAAGKAVHEAFQPWKMNYSCYGNQVPHIHWHLFPRYESDPDHLRQPWHHAEDFDQHPTQEQERVERIQLIRAKLKG
jgi:diadenosine tetraphosphate (Ap4A) HIT family hydrolase